MRGAQFADTRFFGVVDQHPLSTRDLIRHVRRHDHQVGPTLQIGNREVRIVMGAPAESSGGAR